MAFGARFETIKCHAFVTVVQGVNRAISLKILQIIEFAKLIFCV